MDNERHALDIYIGVDLSHYPDTTAAVRVSVDEYGEITLTPIPNEEFYIAGLTPIDDYTNKLGVLAAEIGSIIGCSHQWTPPIFDDPKQKRPDIKRGRKRKRSNTFDRQGRRH